MQHTSLNSRGYVVEYEPTPPLIPTACLTKEKIICNGIISTVDENVDGQNIHFFALEHPLLTWNICKCTYTTLRNNYEVYAVNK